MSSRAPVESKTGILAEIIYRNEENGYTVAVMETDEEYLTIVGNLPACNEGTRYCVTGSFQTHPRYGMQFAFTEQEEKLPEGREEILAFLSAGVIRGIGPATAAAIVQTFGEDTLRIMEEEPDRLTEVSGIGEKTKEKIRESFEEHRTFAKVSLELQQMGLSTAQAFRLYRVLGRNAMALLRENPYLLVSEVPGFGFSKADAIAKEFGIAEDDAVRLQSGIRYGMRAHAGEGNTCFPADLLCESVAQLLDVTVEQVQGQLEALALEGDAMLDQIDGVTMVYPFRYYQAEKKVAHKLMMLARSPLRAIAADVDSLLVACEQQRGIALTEKQKDAVKSSLFSGVSVITGGPGTGKTTIINALINIFEKCGLQTAICAPTGRAAKRITETSGHSASTIHRLLEYAYMEDEDLFRFGKNSESMLEYHAVVVDESSMIDLMLMDALTDAIRPGTRLILVGDQDQLPSVGAGNILGDIIRSEQIHCVRLKEIFRQAEESMIVVNAHQINRGEYPSCNGKDTDFFFLARQREDELESVIVDLVSKRLPGYFPVEDALRDIQVMTPVKKGPIGTQTLNRALQRILNPPATDKVERAFGDKVFRTGDKVMQVRNNYQIVWHNTGDGSEGQGVFNGEVGFVVSIDKEYGQMTVRFDEEKIATYDFGQLEELELAYAITVHKSQGSEFPIVVMPISWFPPMLATRNLLYTAVTRAQQAVVLAGDWASVKAMVDNNRIALRYSGLEARLRQYLAWEEDPA